MVWIQTLSGSPWGGVSRVRLVLVCALALALSSCIGLRRADRQDLAELRGLGIGATEQAVTSPLAAGLLNLLPGIGNFYLAASADEGPQWGLGLLNLLTWPLSVLWAPAQVAVDANTLNKLATIDHYKHTPIGRRELGIRERIYKEAASTGSDLKR